MRFGGGILTLENHLYNKVDHCVQNIFRLVGYDIRCIVGTWRATFDRTLSK